jgi:hypothetical protein
VRLKKRNPPPKRNRIFVIAALPEWPSLLAAFSPCPSVFPTYYLGFNSRHRCNFWSASNNKSLLFSWRSIFWLCNSKALAQAKSTLALLGFRQNAKKLGGIPKSRFVTLMKFFLSHG